jgi:hypothetical protein
LKDTGLSYSIVNRQITISRKPLAEESKTEINTTNEVVQQTEKTITGRVVDEKGEAIIGANIVEVGSTNGTITDVDGRFTFRVANDASIKISYMGYLSQTINTTGRTDFNITLMEDMQSLEEVVVVGYGTQRKENLTGAVSTVNVGGDAGKPSHIRRGSRAARHHSRAHHRCTQWRGWIRSPYEDSRTDWLNCRV